MSITRLWLFLGVALPILAALLATMSTVDLTYHLRAGSEIFATRAIPSVDSWTFSAGGEPWVDQQWGSQVLLAAVYKAAGWTGLALLRAAATAVVFGALAAIGLRRGLDARTAALLTLAAFVVAAPAMALRPQLLGMACFAIVLLLFAGRRHQPRGVWFVPVIVAVWANLHGSFVLGPLVLGLAWLEDVHDRVAKPHRTLVFMIVSAVAACITPTGPGVWSYATGLSTNASVSARISEWQPTSLRDVAGIAFFASVLAIVALMARGGRRVPWPTLAWLGVFFLLGVYALRGVAWWPLAAVPAVAGILISPAPDPVRVETPTLRRLNAVVATGLVVVGVMLLPLWRPIEPGADTPVGVLSDAPAGVTGALREMTTTGDRIFNPQRWGSWLEYALPGATYVVDSRIEFFPPRVWADYEQVTGGTDGWRDRLESWGVTVIVGEDIQQDFRGRLVANGWTEAYSDADGWVLTRGDRAGS